MSPTIFSAVIGAAALHALWNSLLQKTPDKYLGALLMLYACLPIALVAIVIFPLPDAASWPYIIAGGLLHTLYQIFLARAYSIGDFASVYPIARGSAPLFLLLGTWVFASGTISPAQSGAILLIVLAIAGMTFFSPRAPQSFNAVILSVSVVTGLTIAGYSFVDGIGARLSGNAMSFYAWLVLCNALVMTALQFHRLSALKPIIETCGIGRYILIGLLSYSGFAITIWAFTKAPIALVAALRESSILFAIVFAFLIVGERPRRHQMAGGAAIALGAVALRLV